VGCPYWARSVATVRGSVDGRPSLPPSGQPLPRLGVFAGPVAVRARVGRPCITDLGKVRRVSSRSAGASGFVGGLGSGCRAPGRGVTCRRSGFGRAGDAARGSVFPDVGLGARWMDSGPTRRDVIPADGNVFRNVGPPTPQTAHSTLIVGPAGDLGEQRRGPNHSCTRSPPGPLTWGNGPICGGGKSGSWNIRPSAGITSRQMGTAPTRRAPRPPGGHRARYAAPRAAINADPPGGSPACGRPAPSGTRSDAPRPRRGGAS